MQDWLPARERVMRKYHTRMPLAAPSLLRAVVAIPVRDEAERIAHCIMALCNQRSLAGSKLLPGTFGIVLLANNCTDDTVAIAKAMLARSGVPFLVAEERFAAPLANVGFARGVALELAACWLRQQARCNGVILTTDADSRVPRDWVARSVAAVDAGCGAVAGRVRLQCDEMKRLGPVLQRRDKLENAYEQTLLRLQAHIDPIFHDPWPNHWAASGASYALSLDAYSAVGGLPMVASGEDHALASALERRDIAIRHEPNLIVTTSARLQGRAEGGVAEALRLRAEIPDLPGDARLEPLPNALRRFVWRARLRHWHALGSRGLFNWVAPLALPALAVEWDRQHFGTLWEKVETTSPLLRRDALRPSQLSTNIRAAQEILDAMTQAALSRGSGNPADIQALLPVEPHEFDVA